MIFYHFTDLEALIGPEGREALSKAKKDRSDDVDVAGFATPGSILADGIKPSLGQDDDNFVHLLRRPLPPVVWLTINPDWIEGFGAFRLTVGVLSDHRLVHWPNYVRKHARDSEMFGRAGSAPKLRLGNSMYLYFGTIPSSRIRPSIGSGTDRFPSPSAGNCPASSRSSAPRAHAWMSAKAPVKSAVLARPRLALRHGPKRTPPTPALPQTHECSS